MSLVNSAAELKSFTGLSTSASEKAFAYHPQAKKDLKGLIGADTYDTLEDGLPSGEDSQIAARAEALLALHHSMTVLNMRPADNGGLLRLVGHGDYQEELMSPQQLDRVKSQLYAMVMDLIGDFLPALDEEDSEQQFIGKGFGITAV